MDVLFAVQSHPKPPSKPEASSHIHSNSEARVSASRLRNSLPAPAMSGVSNGSNELRHHTLPSGALAAVAKVFDATSSRLSRIPSSSAARRLEQRHPNRTVIAKKERRSARRTDEYCAVAIYVLIATTKPNGTDP